MRAAFALPIALSLLAGASAPALAADDAKDSEKKKILGRIDGLKDAYDKAKDLDPAQAVSVSGLNLDYDGLKLVLNSGTVIPRQAIEGRVISAVFIGSGQFTFEAPWKVESDELERYTGERRLDHPIDQAFFYFDSDLWTRIQAAGQPAQPDKKTLGAANQVWKSRRASVDHATSMEEFTSLAMSIRIGIADGRPAGLTWVDAHLDGVKKGKDWFSYLYQPQWREEVSLHRVWPYPLNPDRWDGEFICSFNRAEDRKLSDRDQSFENRSPLDVDDYVSDFTIYKDKLSDQMSLKAVVKLGVTAREDNVKYARFSLVNESPWQGEITVRAIGLAEGKDPLPYFHDNGEIAIELPKPLTKGEKTSLTFYYGGPVIAVIVQPKPQATLEQQNAASGDDRAALTLASYGLLNEYAWYPRSASLNDRFVWDWTIHLERPLEAAVSGTTISETVEGDYKVMRVKEVVPSNFPAILIGRYVITADTVQLPDGRSVGVRVYSHPGASSVGAKDILQRAKECLLVFSQYFGPYPFQELDMAQMAYGFSFAQAPSGLVQMTGEVYLSKTFLATFYRARDPAGYGDFFIPHEIAHEWWGSRVGNLTYRDYWYVETLAEFSAALFMEVARKDGYTQRRQTWYDEDGAKVHKTGPLGVGYRSNERTRSSIYRRGPLLMDKLMNQLGREKLMLALRAWADQQNNSDSCNADLQRALEAATGMGFDEFFNLYVEDNVDLNATPEDIAAILAGKPPPSAGAKKK